jgi:hypothetical protein
MKAIADTGFLVAFANPLDAYHQWALGLASQVTEPLLTCEAVRQRRLIISATSHPSLVW